MIFIPEKYFFQQGIFTGQGDRSDRSGIGINTHGNTGCIDLIRSVVFNRIVHVCLNITGRANFQVYILLAEKGQ